MNRISVWIGIVAGVLFAVFAETAQAQDGTFEGFPPQTLLFNDTVLLARALPFVVALAIGFGIWQGKASLRQSKSSPNSTTVIRHDFGTVIAHWTNGIGFIAGMITGLVILRWLPRPDEIRVIFAIHYIGAGMILFGVASHLAQNAVTGGAGLIPRSFKDLRDGIAELVEYTGVYGSARAVFGIKLPKFIRDTFGETFSAFGLRPAKSLGKFLPVEKVFSYTPWAIIITVIVVTGLIKSFRYLYPIPLEFIAQVTTIHDIFGYVSVFMLAAHLAAILLVPRHWALLIAMLTTRIKREYVRQWHPQWYKDLVAQEQATTRVSPAPATQASPQTAEETRA